uniref:putative carbonic anhydrase 3 n=1 Tax=Vespula vulgaris TaxID=7454 RepID=UPI00213816E8|nr:putative carbonic anhydrase 3 [Vespula vulgaris]
MWIYSTFLVVIAGLHTVRTADWSYWGDHGPDNWPGQCKTGKKQSPINIVTVNTIKKDLGELNFIRYDHSFTGMVTNNGHTIQVNLHDSLMQLESEYLSLKYTFEQLHFHWGSEHTINNYRYPLELHLVHYNDQYNNVSIASEHKNGIVVVTVLFELSQEDNKALDPIINATEQVSRWVGSSTAELRAKLVPHLLLPNNRKSYYTYEGSLTTPNCQEAVTWFIMTENLTISEAQLRVFQGVESANGTLKFNYRPSQNEGDREIYHHLSGYSNARKMFSVHIYLIIFCLSIMKLT